MIRVDRKLNSTDVVDVLTYMFILRGTPEFIRSDNIIFREAKRMLGRQVPSHRQQRICKAA